LDWRGSLGESVLCYCARMCFCGGESVDIVEDLVIRPGMHRCTQKLAL